MKNMFNSFKRLAAAFLLTALCLWTQSTGVKASHILGGDLSYQYMGPYTYSLTLRIYRDCSGIFPQTSYMVNSSGNCGAFNQTFTLTQVGGATQVSSCLVGNTTCTGGALPGVELYVYTGVANLQGNCGEYTLSFDNCCRSAAITNLLNAASESFHIESKISTAQASNSPVFPQVFNPFACVNQHYLFNHGCTDGDGDSLTYTLVTALGSTGPAVYNAGYNALNPVSSVAGTQLFNSSTGMFEFTPDQLQFSSVTVRVDEYRSGVWIGSSMRDYGIWVINCGANMLCGQNLLSGRVYHDVNANCSYDTGVDPPMAGTLVKVMPGPLYQYTGPGGNYEFHLASGTYTVEQVLPLGSYFQDVCHGPGFSYAVSFPNLNDSSLNNHFPNDAIVDCAQMRVDAAIGIIRPCSVSTINVSYCNVGSDTAYNAYVTVDLGPDLTYVASSLAPSGNVGSVYTFPIGTVPHFDCGNFAVYAQATCDLNLVGNTLCVEAHIYPDSSCAPDSAAWDHSSLSVTGSCVNDSLACFTVTNTGSPLNGFMQGPSEFRILVNNILVYTGYLQLCGGCDTTICWPAQGNTIRFEVDQRPGHPGNSHPNDEIEQCGNPNQSAGQVGQLPLNDADQFIDIFCRQVVLSYDPNNKEASPIGTYAQHYITASDALDYVINFQNTGNDTAFSVVIRDTLDSHLDLTTLHPGVMSHNGVFNIVGPGVLEWVFEGIALPDSNVNEPASHGFVTFSVKQMPGNALGTVIYNRAAITFDINVPVMTNQTWHTIGEPVVTGVSRPVNLSANAAILLYPNPASESVNVKVEGLPAGERVEVRVYDLAGVQVMALSGVAEREMSLDCSGLATGMYLVQVNQGSTALGAAKFVKE